MIGDAGRAVAEEVREGQLEAISMELKPEIVSKLREARDLVQKAEAILESMPEESIWNEAILGYFNEASEMGCGLDLLAYNIERT